MKEEIKYNSKYNCYVSNMGYIIRGNGQKSYPTKRSDGYYVVRDGKGMTRRIHRIVAETFLKCTNSNMEVNHKDGNKSNNKLNNLEWTTRGDNLEHAYRTGLRKTTKGSCKLTISDAQKIYDSWDGTNTKELALTYNIHPSTVRNIVKGINSYGGICWPEVKRKIKPTPKKKIKNYTPATNDGLAKKVEQIDIKTGKVIKVYESVSQALRETGITNIGSVANGRRKSAGGFGWKFLDDK